ncbi:MAG: acyl-CoA dehydrogenase family protein [Chloroflexi bacterium]|nr:acyl-CoA dehydrogenase family protein [Chloroflexota bacterium]
MDFVFSPQDEAFRAEVRDFYRKELPATWYGGYDERDTLIQFIKGVRKKLATKGWLTMAWPKEYGGSDAPVTQQLVFAEESAYWRFNARDAGIGYLGPAIMKHGTEEQKQRFLGPIARAEISFHQGFSEPNAGSDLAGLTTRAQRDGDFFTVNGQKIWGGHLDVYEYSFFLARTNPDVPKHKGISFFVIPSSTKGLKYEKFGNLAGGEQMIVYYDNCRVPARESLIGEENQGWYIATTVLNHERTVIEHAASGIRMLEELVALWKQQNRGRRLDGPNLAVKHKLAQAAIELEVCRMLAYRIGWLQQIGQSPTFEASQVKIFGSEMTQRFSHIAGNMLGLYAQMDRKGDRRHLFLDGRVEHLIRQQIMFSIVGGANEIQRNVIAGRGLGLPRA